MNEIKNACAVTAVKVVNLYLEDNSIDIIVQLDSMLKRDKSGNLTYGCARTAFIGLCEAGRVKGIPKGEYIKKGIYRSKDYAIAAADIVLNNPTKKYTQVELWAEATEKVRTELKYEPAKSHNGQMAIVLILKEDGLLI